MNFYPQDKFPKKGTPVYNGNGEQYNLSDPKYAYQDGLQNTQKYPNSSTDNLYSTIDSALARAKQIGCEGYHQVTENGISYYKPCSTSNEYDLRIEQLDSALNFTYIGNYRVLTWDTPFERASSYNGWIINTLNSINDGPSLDSEDISIEFRYSVDGKTWSLWENVGTALNGVTNNFSEIYQIPLDPNNKFYPEFRFTSVLKNPDGTFIEIPDSPMDSNIVITDFQLDITYAAPAETPIVYPSPICSNEISKRPIIFSDCKFTFRPYNVNKAVNLYTDLSYMVNNIFGFDVNYYSVQPQARGRDVSLREYTLFDVVDEKCVKIMVPGNQFPDNKINFDPFGLQFEEPFEIHIDKRYFEQNFGKGSQPRKRDIIYFPLTNRIYEINSMYLFRDFMYSPVYFKIELKKYQPKSNTYYQDPAYKEELEGIALTTESLFGEEISAEEKKIAKPQQYGTINTLTQDPVRSYIYKDLSIVGYDLNNNWTIVFNHYYDLSSAFNYVPEFTTEVGSYRNAIRYKELPKFSPGEELAYTCWFSMKNVYNAQSLSKNSYPIRNLTLVSNTSSEITFSSSPAKHGLSTWSSYADNPEGYVSILGDESHTGGYKVLDVIDDYTFIIENKSTTFSQVPITWKMQKAQSRNLFDGLYDTEGNTYGIRIDIIHSGVVDDKGVNFLNVGSFLVRINDTEFNSTLQFVPTYSEWYGLVFNLSNKYKQISINGWSMSFNAQDTLDQTSSLISVHQDLRSFTSNFVFDAPSNPQPSYLAHSDSYFELGGSGGITIESQLDYIPGQSINVYKSASNYQISQVTSYNSVTGSLTFDDPTTIVGSTGSTGSSWIVNLTDDPFYGTDNNTYKIWTGPVYLSNIRLFKNMIDIDVQSTVLNQNIVRDEQNAHIIDNCKPLLGLPKFARNR
jgi:hypothetical protein